MDDIEVVSIDSSDDAEPLAAAIPKRSLTAIQQDIEDILIKRREYIKNNPVRTVLMVMAEEYVEKYNLDNPATPIEAITSEVLELVAMKSWSDKAKRACEAIHEMEKIVSIEETIPSASALLPLFEEKGRLIDEERKKLLAQPKPPKERSRRVIEEFRHLISNVKKETTITMNAAGKVRMIVLDKIEIQQPKNVGEVPTEMIATQTISFNLPDNIVHDSNFNHNDVMAFWGEGNIEFVYNVKSKIFNGKRMKIHYVPQ